MKTTSSAPQQNAVRINSGRAANITNFRFHMIHLPFFLLDFIFQLTMIRYICSYPLCFCTVSIESNHRGVGFIDLTKVQQNTRLKPWAQISLYIVYNNLISQLQTVTLHIRLHLNNELYGFLWIYTEHLFNSNSNYFLYQQPIRWVMIMCTRTECLYPQILRFATMETWGGKSH